MGSSLFYFEAEESYGHHEAEEPHFLDTCCRCRRPLAADRDIFMYKGIKAFCSEGCRESQIEIDCRPPRQPKNTCWNFSASFRALRKAIPAAARSWRPSSSSAAAAATTA